MKRIILILGLVFSMVAVDAKPQKGPKGKGKALKERFEAAKKKRDAKRGDAKKKGHKHKGPRGEFGKLVRNDEKIKELKKELVSTSRDKLYFTKWRTNRSVTNITTKSTWATQRARSLEKSSTELELTATHSATHNFQCESRPIPQTAL